MAPDRLDSTIPQKTRHVGKRFASLIIPALILMTAGNAEARDDTTPVRGRVLIVRGIFSVFSLGMDTLADKLRNEGYDVRVTTSAWSHQTAASLKSEILASRNAESLFIIGHSLGGDLAPGLAKSFGEDGLRVDMLIMLDSTMPSSPPANVRCCVNLYQSNYSPSWCRVFRGTDIDAASSTTEMINVDVRKVAAQQQAAKINHFNIDSDPWIHDLVIRAVNIGDQKHRERFPLPRSEFRQSSRGLPGKQATYQTPSSARQRGTVPSTNQPISTRRVR